MSLSANIAEKANLIWAIADKLTGVYKPHEYGEVILPLTVIRRFDCILADTKQAVLKKAAATKVDAIKGVLLCKASGHAFYNTSKFTFEKLLDDPDNIEANFHDYLNGFSENVRDIIEKFKFDGHIATMAKKDILYIVLKEFTTDAADLHPAKISNLEMGYIFEEITRRFSEAHNEDAGQHYTPREVIELMVNILFHDDDKALSSEHVAKSVYDPACGTGGMLSVAESYLKKINAGAELIPFGQELNDQTFAICKADMLIKGNNADYIKDGNTLSHDQFPGRTFDYILSNPPFGREWKNEQPAIEQEAKLGFAGRFGPGLPAVGDGQMLFLLTTLAKMNTPENGGSRIAIIHNGSPLFTGDAGSGPSEIRRYLLENDLLEAIIALPNDIFYNTGIATYIWVVSNRKSPKRRGKVQLINANGLFEKRRKALGNKRNDIPQSAIDDITRLYGDMKPSDISKVFRNEEFGYTKITVERPKLDAKGKPVMKKGKPEADASLRDTENIPLTEDIQDYFKREVKPFAPDLPAPRPSSGEFCIYVLKCSDESFYIGQTEDFSRRLREHESGEVSWTAPRRPVEPIHWEVFLTREEAVKREHDLKTGFGRKWLKREYDHARLAAASRQAGAWIDESKTKIGYEIPFTRYFYQYEAPKPAEEIKAEILAIEKDLDNALHEIFG